MTRLTPRMSKVVMAPRLIRHRTHETAVSRLVRLAAANAMSDIPHLIRLTPNLPHQHAFTRDVMVELAARIGGFDVNEVAVATPVRTARLITFAGDHQFTHYRMRFGRVCPACIEADLARLDGPEFLRPFRRSYWDVPAISTCPEHRVLLVNSCGDCGRSLDEKSLILRCGCGPQRLEKRMLDPSATEHDTWLLGRLGIIPAHANAFLDRMPIDVASRLCRVVGKTIAGDEWGYASNEDADDLAVARSRGWRLLLGGEQAVWRLFDEIVARERSEGRWTNTSYGYLHRFMAHEEARSLEGLRKMLIEHAAANIGVSPSGTRLFGRRIDKADWISVGQLARTLKASVDLIRSLVSHVCPEVATPGTVLLSAAQAKTVTSAWRSSMRTPEAMALMGIEDSLLGVLRDAKQLEFVLPTGRAQMGLVTRRSVASVVRCLDAPPRVVAAGLLPPNALAYAARVSIPDVLLAVLRGELKAVGRLADVPGFSGLLFSRSDGDRLLTLLRGDVLKKVALRELGWQAGTIVELQRLGLIEARARSGVSLKSLAKFRRSHVSAREINEWLAQPMTTEALHRIMRDSGLASIGSGNPAVTTFWRRASAARVLRHLIKPGADIQATGFGMLD